MESHLLQMRGLKHSTLVNLNPIRVASFTDAWIETMINVEPVRLINVASFTDAWIETKSTLYALPSSSSHLLQMRGLKRK